MKIFSISVPFLRFISLLLYVSHIVACMKAKHSVILILDYFPNDFWAVKGEGVTKQLSLLNQRGTKYTNVDRGIPDLHAPQYFSLVTGKLGVFNAETNSFPSQPGTGRTLDIRAEPGTSRHNGQLWNCQTRLPIPAGRRLLV